MEYVGFIVGGVFVFGSFYAGLMIGLRVSYSRDVTKQPVKTPIELHQEKKIQEKQEEINHENTNLMHEFLFGGDKK